MSLYWTVLLCSSNVILLDSNRKKRAQRCNRKLNYRRISLLAMLNTLSLVPLLLKDPVARNGLLTLNFHGPFDIFTDRHAMTGQGIRCTADTILAQFLECRRCHSNVVDAANLGGSSKLCRGVSVLWLCRDKRIYGLLGFLARLGSSELCVLY